MREHYLFGKEFNNRYINKTKFLSPTYNASEISIQSSTINRCILSAKSFLKGLYPFGTGPLLSPTIDVKKAVPPYDLGTKNITKLGRDVVPGKGWAFPIQNVDKFHDPLLNPTATC